MPDPAQSVGLVLDASVWINLLATDAMEAILGALAVPCYAPDQVVAEVTRHPATGATFPAGRHPLRLMSPLVSILSLEGRELDLFLEIVGAPSGDALGDGEAAAISVAASRGLDLIVDDRKARRILKERFSQLSIYWTVDLLRAPSVVAALGRSHADACFARACRIGRMHVPRKK
jgi:predicted nucleic acid-binding protein